MYLRAKLLQSCPTLCNPMDCSLPATLSMGLSRQEYWSGLPCPSSGDLPNPGIEPRFCIAGRFFTIWATWEAQPVTDAYKINSLLVLLRQICIWLGKGLSKVEHVGEEHLPISTSNHYITVIIIIILGWEGKKICDKVIQFLDTGTIF